MSELEKMIVEKGKVNNRITPADIENNIIETHYFTIGEALDALAGDETITRHPELDCTTLCVLVLKNGTSVIGQAQCADPANFDYEIGRVVAKRKAVDEVYRLMGYELKTKLASQ